MDEAGLHDSLCEEIMSLQKENSQLKTRVEQLEEEDRQWEKSGLVSLMKERDQLKAELAQCQKERDNWHEIVKDHCDADDEFRALAGPYDTSCSLGVDSHVEILERVMNKLTNEQQRAARLREALRELHGIVKSKCSLLLLEDAELDTKIEKAIEEDQA